MLGSGHLSVETTENYILKDISYMANFEYNSNTTGGTYMRERAWR